MYRWLDHTSERELWIEDENSKAVLGEAAVALGVVEMDLADNSVEATDLLVCEDPGGNAHVGARARRDLPERRVESVQAGLGDRVRLL